MTVYYIDVDTFVEPVPSIDVATATKTELHNTLTALGEDADDLQMLINELEERLSDIHLREAAYSRAYKTKNTQVAA